LDSWHTAAKKEQLVHTVEAGVEIRALDVSLARQQKESFAASA
jgi:hypothetical protein